MCTQASCCAGPWVRRRYISRAEKIERLEAYAEALEHELAGVRERVQELASQQDPETEQGTGA